MLWRFLMLSLALTQPAWATSKCPHIWAQNEAKHRQMNLEGKAIELGSSDNAQVDVLLGSAFTVFLKEVDQHLQALGESEVLETLAKLEKLYPNFGPIPNPEPETDAIAQWVQKVVDAINGLSFEDALYKNPRDGSTYFSALQITEEYLKQIITGRDWQFHIPEDVWAILRARNPARYEKSYKLYQDFLTELPALTAQLEPFRQSFLLNDQQHSRFFPDYLGLLRIMNVNAQEQFPANWIKQKSVDFSLSPEHNLPTNALFFSVILPVGEYGVGFNIKLRRTVQILEHILSQRFLDVGADIFETAPTLLKTQTQRGRLQKREGGPSPVLRATTEGFYSIAQYLNLLLFWKIGESSNPDAWVEDLMLPHQANPNSRLVELTARLRMGTLGPSTLGLLRFPLPLQQDADGHLEPTAHFKKELKSRLYENNRNRLRFPEKHRAGLPCPVASQHSCQSEKTGLQYASDSFLRIYQIISRAQQ